MITYKLTMSTMTPHQKRQASGLSAIFDIFGDEIPRPDLGTAFFAVSKADEEMRMLDTLAEAIEQISPTNGGEA